jgi:DNA-3-methyladenine glycosylase II
LTVGLVERRQIAQRVVEAYFANTATPSRRSSRPFASLARSIVGQQLSTKAADSIWKRFSSLFPKKQVTATHLSTLPDETLRAAGLSGGKVKALRSLAVHVQQHKTFFKNISRRPTAEIYERLVEVHGIGPWTVEMFLMFTLRREDIFSPGDLGLRKGIQKLYGLSSLPTPQESSVRAARWAPYRTYASRALWHLLDT